MHAPDQLEIIKWRLFFVTSPYRAIYEARAFVSRGERSGTRQLPSSPTATSRVLGSIESGRELFFVEGGSLLTFAGCEGAYQSRHQHAEQQEQGTRFRPHRVGVTVVRRSFVHFTTLNRGMKETATLFTMKFSVVENRTCNGKIKNFLKINYN